MRIAGILGLALAFLTTPAFAADTWSTFTDPSGTFRLDLPQEPVVIAKTRPAPNGGQAKSEAYVVDRAPYGILVKVDDYVGPPADAAMLIDRAVTGLQQHDRRLVSDASATVDGHTGRDVTLITGTGATMKDRLFLIDNRLYQMLTTVPANAATDQVDMVERCSRSLHFLK